jgi:hypothetical protein
VFLPESSMLIAVCICKVVVVHVTSVADQVVLLVINGAQYLLNTL